MKNIHSNYVKSSKFYSESFSVEKSSPDISNFIVSLSNSMKFSRSHISSLMSNNIHSNYVLL